MDELLKTIKALRLRDFLIISFVLLLLIVFMSIFLGNREVEVTPTPNAYIECLKEKNVKNKYDVRSGILKTNNRFLTLDQYYLLESDYSFCATFNEDDYKRYVDKYGTKYPTSNSD